MLLLKQRWKEIFESIEGVDMASDIIIGRSAEVMFIKLMEIGRGE